MSDQRSRAGPYTVSIILPVYNEAGIIEQTVTSLLSQRLEQGGHLELLVIDGQSSDGSRELVERAARADPRLRLLSNPSRTTSCAFNIGLRAARGAYVCILGAHCTYAPDYIAVCLREMAAHGAVGCTGRTVTRPAGDTLGARLAHWAMSHPFGVSDASFRRQREGYADSIAYPVFLKAPLIALGGYDEAMVRNQDNDMNQRLRAAGYKLYCTWQTACEYRARADLRALMAYARSNGFWCGISARTNPASLGTHHFAPFAFLVTTCLGLVLAPLALRPPSPAAWLAALPLGLHLLIGHVAAFGLVVRERRLSPVLLPWVLLAFHLRYGAAFARGVVSSAPDALRRRA